MPVAIVVEAIVVAVMAAAIGVVMAAVAAAIGLVATVTVGIGTAVAGRAATALVPAGGRPLLDGSGFATKRIVERSAEFGLTSP
jgi:hypothetical protein